MSGHMQNFPEPPENSIIYSTAEPRLFIAVAWVRGLYRMGKVLHDV